MKIILLLAIAYFAYKIVTVFKLIGNSNSNDDIKDEYKNLDITDAEFEDVENENEKNT
jgi:hypothetical protein|tara:strand:- start:933 stop:1106 length:174 start_codon:yes stop_codon:yes gene_type:complete